MIRSKWERLLWIGVIIAILAVACNSQSTALNQAEQNAANANYVIPTRGIERRNYNWRQELGDDPSVILWCTSAFSTPGSPMFTVPIIGKLTSGGKRPFPQYNSSSYENPGADGMYGNSSEYRYGFGPTGKLEYYEMYGVETFCTTQPTVWQKEATIIVQEKDPALMDATAGAQEALRNGDGELAQRILVEAIKQLQP